VPVLRQEVLRAGRGGELPVTIDLTAVTHLSSAGVQMLHTLSATGQPGALRHPPVLIAASGSPAAYVLDLAGLVRTSDVTDRSDRADRHD
jgi:hypothetical protein